MFLHHAAQCIGGKILPFGNFVRIGLRNSIGRTGEYMIELVFYESVIKIGVVAERKAMLELAGQSHLFAQAAVRSIHDIFSGPRMTAARVGPQAGRMIFPCGAAVQKPFAFGVENANRQGPVKRTGAMGLHFFHYAGFVIGLVDQYYILVRHRMYEFRQ